MVDTSLLEAGIAYTIWESSGYFADGDIPGPLGSAHRVSVLYQALLTSDGYINIGAATQRTWEQLCRAIGQEELIEDQRFREPETAKRERRNWQLYWRKPSAGSPRTTGWKLWRR